MEGISCQRNWSRSPEVGICDDVPTARRAVLASLSLSVVVAAMILPAGPSGALGAAPVVPAALPSGPTDSSTVPHYFGPWPNWANSPFTLPAATVAITGDGAGAAATATVDPVSGGIAAVEVTEPGSGYTTAPQVDRSPAATARRPPSRRSRAPAR